MRGGMEGGRGQREWAGEGWGDCWGEWVTRGKLYPLLSLFRVAIYEHQP